MDILDPKQAIVDIDQQKLVLPLCKSLQADLAITAKQSQISSRVVLAKQLVTILANLVAPVPIQLKARTQLPSNQDFLF